MRRYFKLIRTFKPCEIKSGKAFFLAFIFLGNNSFAQDSIPVVPKTNPIVFYEGYGGVGGANSSGWVIGATVNYQFFKNDLITARLGAFAGYDNHAAMLAPAVGLPIFRERERIVDYGILYGKRWISGGFSVSVSGGISGVNRKHYEVLEESYYEVRQHSLGFPFEVNVKWFKERKKRFRAYYGLIPIGTRKVGFGRSIGLKLVGNISKTNYIGGAISYGFGWHKKY